MTTRFLLFFHAAWLLTMLPVSGADGLHYTIQADVNLKSKVISGHQTVTVTNRSSGELREIHFFLFPNLYQEENPDLNEMNYLWHHPSGFDPGGLEIETAEEAGTGRPLQSEQVTPPGLPENTVLKVLLSSPLAAGSQIDLRLSFNTKIPYKYGPFGHYRQTVTAQGGWHPYLVPIDSNGSPQFDGAPEPASFQIDLRLDRPRDVVLNGRYFQSVSELHFESPSDRLASFVIAPRFFVSSETVSGRKVTYFRLNEERYKLQHVMESFTHALESIPSFSDIDAPEEVTIVETYLRAVMSYPAEDMILLSDRFMVTVEMFDFRNLNRLEIGRAIAYQLFVDEIVERENPLNQNWVAETYAWAFRNHFLRTQFKELSNLRETAGRMGMFRPFNRMAASPTIPFSETYVGSTLLRDPFRESLFYFNHQLLSGQVFLEKLKNTVGEDSFQRIIEGYLRQPQDFQSYVTEVVGQDMSWFFQQWKSGYPSGLDYSLRQVERNVKSNGEYVTRFTVVKEGGEGFVDPVEVRVHKEGGESEILVWEGQGTSKSFEVKSQEKVTLIEIDPHNQTVQLEGYNDLHPHKWEYVMDRGDVDVGSGGLGAGMRIRMHKVRDRSKWLFVLPFFSPAELGAEAGILFNPGGTVEGLAWAKKHELSFSYIFTDLRGGFADEESGKVDATGQASGVKFRYSFVNKRFEEDPMNFEALEFTSALYREEFGGDFNFFRSTLTGSKAIAIHPKHKLAGIISLGYSEGFRDNDEVPAQKLFDLASTSHIGFAQAGRFLAKNSLTTSLEWRHDLMSDINMSMPMNNRIRRLQGVLSFDVGWLNDHFDEMFRLNEAVFGVGYGLRFHYDFLGVRPSDFTFDVGWRLGDGPRDGGSRFVFALGILQTF